MEDILFQLMKRLTEGEGEPDYSTWVQVATLTSEEKLRWRNMHRQKTLILAKAKKLIAQLEKLKADAEVVGAEWWETLHINHSLPTARFHIMESGKIMMKPGSEE